MNIFEKIAFFVDAYIGRLKLLYRLRKNRQVPKVKKVQEVHEPPILSLLFMI